MSEPGSGRRASEAVAVARSLVLLVIYQLIPLLVSWRWDWAEARALVVLQLGGFVASRALLWRKHPDLVRERSRALDKTDAEPWDRRVVGLIFLASAAVLVVAGLEARGAAEPTFGLGAEVAAVLVQLAAMVFGTWAMWENRFFEGLVRLQRDRGHVVVTTGPYALVRHPGYLSSIAVSLTIPVLLGSVWAFAPTVVSIGVLVYRTAREDRTLHAGLEGYAAYARRTRYRLFPGLW